MPNRIGEIAQKAFFLGVGAAAFAVEKGGSTLQELRSQAQKLAEEMVKKGELKSEEAKKFVDDLVQQAQQQQFVKSEEKKPEEKPHEPRRIEIVDEEETPSQSINDVDSLRQQVEALQAELKNLKKN